MSRKTKNSAKNNISSRNNKEPILDYITPNLKNEIDILILTLTPQLISR